MTEATCKREIELEIPSGECAEGHGKSGARHRARRARPGVPSRQGSRITLIRRRFAEDIQGEVVQSLVPEYLEKALDEKKMIPVTRPEVDQVQFKEGEPLKFRAVFEVLPDFELGDYKDLQVQIDEIKIGDEQVEKTLEEMRERGASYVPVEGRAGEGRRLRASQADGHSGGRRRTRAGR
jgi:trigger factor